jgi:putative transcriptional regulator
LTIRPGLTLTTSRDILGDIGRNVGPSRYLIALGCSGWSPGQLEQEIKDNSWFTCPATEDIIFSTDFTHKPDMAAATLGFSMAQLTSDVGYS